MLQEGLLAALDLPAGKQAEISLPIRKIKVDSHTEYWLRMSVQEKNDRAWCQAGYELASEQLLLQAAVEPAKQVAAHGSVDEKDEGDWIQLSAGSCTARITSYNVCYTKLLRLPAESLYKVFHRNSAGNSSERGYLPALFSGRWPRS